MRQETPTIKVNEKRSRSTTIGQLILSASGCTWGIDLTVGRIGFPSVQRGLALGGSVLYETPDDGLVEVRLTGYDRLRSEYVTDGTLLISQVSPRGGITAGFTKEDVTNTPFEPQEILRLKQNLQEVRDAAAQREDLRPEQFDLLSRKLDYMAQAAERLGRKDWLNLAIGTLTSFVVGAAINSDAARYLFQTAGDALSWLFGAALKLLP